MDERRKIVCLNQQNDAKEEEDEGLLHQSGLKGAGAEKHEYHARRKQIAFPEVSPNLPAGCTDNPLAQLTDSQIEELNVIRGDKRKSTNAFEDNAGGRGSLGRDTVVADGPFDGQKEELENRLLNCKLARIQNQENAFISLKKMNALDKTVIYHDQLPLLKLRKKVIYALLKLQVLLFKVMNHPIFELLSLCVVIANTVLYVVDASRSYAANEVKLSDQWELVFLVIFTLELIIKVYACGFCGRFAFYKSPWNILDSFIVIISWLSYTNVNNMQNYTFFRSLRVLRIYRISASNKKLKLKIANFLRSINYFAEIFIILCFFYSIFAVVGLKLFSGVLQKRCVDAKTANGTEASIGSYCFGDMVCPANMRCERGFADPSMPITSFDNYFNALFVSFQVSLLEGWFALMLTLVAAFPWYLKPLVYVYFVIVIFIGSIFVMNLIKAIIIVQYNKSEKQLEDVHFQKRTHLLENQAFNLLQLKVCRYFDEVYFLKSKEESQPRRPSFAYFGHKGNANHQLSNSDYLTSATNFIELTSHDVRQVGLESEEAESKMVISSDFPNLARAKFQSNRNRKLERKLSFVTPQGRGKLINAQDRPKEFQMLCSSGRMSFEESERSRRRSSGSMRNISEIELSSNNVQEAPEHFGDNSMLGVHQKEEIKSTAYRKLLSKWKRDKHKKLKVLISHEVRTFPYEYFDSMSDVLFTETSAMPSHNILDGLSLQDAEIAVHYNFNLILYERADKLANYNYSETNRVLNFGQAQRQGRKAQLKDFLSIHKWSTFVYQKHFRKQHHCSFLLTIKKCWREYYHFMCSKPVSIYDPKPRPTFQCSPDTSRQVESYIIKSKSRKISSSKPIIAQFFREEFAPVIAASSDESRSVSSNFIVFVSLADFDKSIKQKVSRVWSGFDVLHRRNVVLEKVILVVEQLNCSNYNVWLKSFAGKVQVIRALLRSCITSVEVDYLAIFAIVVNSVVLSLYGIVADDKEYVLDYINYLCTVFFVIEIGLKLLLIGPAGYLRLPMNQLDTLIFIFSIVDLAADSQRTTSSAIPALRLLRMFRIIKIIRLFRYMRFINVILLVFARSWRRLKYLFVIMLTFIFMFSLIGFALFNKTLDQAYPNRYKALNFDNFHESIVFVFNILTVDNWDAGVNVLLLGTQHPAVTLSYYMLWTFAGSIVVLNFFFASILEGFSEPSTVDAIKELAREEKSIVLIFNKKVDRLSEFNSISKLLESVIRNFRSLTFHNLHLTSGSKKFLFRNMVLQQHYRLDKLASSASSDDRQAKIESDLRVSNFSDQSSKINDTQGVGLDNLCSCSLYIFGKSSRPRRRLIKILNNSRFQSFVIFVIVANCLFIAILSYRSSLSKGVLTALLVFDYLSNAFLILEFAMKVVAYGFVLCKRAYVRNGWGLFDFIVVALIVADMIAQSDGNKWFKVVMVSRIFRLISHLDYFKRTLSNLYNSFSAIGNVIIIIALYFLIYGIIGVNFMRNKMNYCADIDGSVLYGKGKADCLLGNFSWSTYDWNFDNIINALVTLYVVAFLDNWQTIMLSAADSSDDSAGAVYRANPYIFIYFISFVLFVVFIIFNLGIGVIYVQYRIEEQRRRLEYRKLQQDENRWLYFMRALLKTHPNFMRASIMRTKVGRVCASVYGARAFLIVTRILILASVVILALGYEGMSDRYYLAIECLQVVLHFCFALEFAVKANVKGSLFFCDKWHNFEFFLVLVSIPDSVLFILSSASVRFAYAYQLFKITRILRVLRLFQVTKLVYLDELHRITQALIITIPSILNILIILILVYYIYAAVAVVAFGDAGLAEFNGFGLAFLNLFRFFTGESWSVVMWKLNKTYRFWGTLYFISFIFITSYLLFNMFALIMIDQFEHLFLDPSSKLNTFNQYKSQFDTVWNLFSSKHGGYRIKEHDLYNLFVSLKAPLGFNTLGKKLDRADFYTKKNFSVDYMILNLREDDKFILSKLSEFRIPVDANQFISYHFVLYYALKLSFESSFQDRGTGKNEIVKKAQKQTLKQLSSMRLNRSAKGVKAYCSPLMKKMFLEALFDTWRSRVADFVEDLPLLTEQPITIP